VPHPTTCVVIANWNGEKPLRKCLTSLFANTATVECKVVVVDNASTDGSLEMLQKRFSQVQVIKNKHNMGFSKANNQGIRYAIANGAKYILLLNNDVEITDKKWLETLIGAFESEVEIGIVGCKLLYPDGRIQHAGGVIKLRGAFHMGEFEEDTGQYNKIEFVDYVTAAAMLIKSDVIRRIGFLDEGFTPLFCEDTDLCVRARFYGYKVAYTPNPTLIHHCGSSANKLGTETKTFYHRRSFIRFFLLNFQLADILKRIIMFELPAALACIIRRNRYGKLPITIRSDASSRVLLFMNAWLPSIRGLKGIISLRRQRFMLGARLCL
jgi:GT2 family glycosyltransferase